MFAQVVMTDRYDEVSGLIAEAFNEIEDMEAHVVSLSQSESMTEDDWHFTAIILCEFDEQI